MFPLKTTIIWTQSTIEKKIVIPVSPMKQSVYQVMNFFFFVLASSFAEIFAETSAGDLQTFENKNNLFCMSKSNEL